MRVSSSAAVRSKAGQGLRRRFPARVPGRGRSSGSDRAGRELGNNERPSRANSPIEALAQPLPASLCDFSNWSSRSEGSPKYPLGRARATQRSLCVAATAPFGAYSDL